MQPAALNGLMQYEPCPQATHPEPGSSEQSEAGPQVGGEPPGVQTMVPGLGIDEHAAGGATRGEVPSNGCQRLRRVTTRNRRATRS